MALIVERPRSCARHGYSVIAFSFRVDTPCTYISTNADPKDISQFSYEQVVA